MTAPCNLHAMQQYFDEKAPEWDSRPAQMDSISRILSLFEIPPGAKILDIACGTGVLFSNLLALRPRGVWAVDISPAMIEIASGKAKGYPINTSVQDFYSLTETGFDLAIAYNAYPHFLDKKHFARAACRALAPGGRLIVAHGTGRHSINGCHGGPKVSSISTPLRPCTQEAAEWEGLLRVDVMVDQPHIYILSGTAPG